MSVLVDLEADTSDRDRRELLAETDQVLEVVEHLNLAERREVPLALRQAVEELQARLGRSDPRRPQTVRAVQHLVFALQQRLMAANPRNPNPRPHLGRRSGQPQYAHTPGGDWKFLTLPARGSGMTRERWLELLQETVDRACDRWAYAQHQALKAARERRPAEPALALARAAWANYWELLCEAERLRVRRPAQRPRGRAARPL